ncbi:Holliday junction branch migration protein RuvA [Zhihengliuella salsuginis]|uniref:Holliday junction branch migration complex subunit RuvA n=1 Tax=Zhihengliuella salsuginis TaxID=578222 RepID=A0ABQ3GK75_9MICC|nr:Holliday junction branch migration protein RuvA [Zhihengliuella salsuginis]GHD12074.1 Holliday junction ATP-dependent DNA helicase RuvA [Zhihengliuella salsuginis]
MISSLSGDVQAVGLNSAVINVGGFGMLVQATPQTLGQLRVGESAEVQTTMVVREDSMTLFGFADTSAREVFEILQSVSGIGPRLALAVLAVLSPEEVRVAVTSADTKALTRVPGVGPKVAQRMALELAGKLAPTGRDEAAAPDASDDAWRAAVLDALTGLGWKEKDATKAIDAFADDEPELVRQGDMPQILRAVLADIGRDRSRGGR